ncbi:hypothetical protein IHE45_08G055200 [Dioscorea alata]|uniref:Uncharacterized protein n=1 Tax=Dioscorea alata TaxID=55571 RepID=A0ACB7VJB9_DIOAL|nr:hypothetical protein IHE45_08G055200 [Dioscorea alata]
MANPRRDGEPSCTTKGQPIIKDSPNFSPPTERRRSLRSWNQIVFIYCLLVVGLASVISSPLLHLWPGHPSPLQ